MRGKFTANGAFEFNGIVLVIGEGDVDAGGLNRGVFGGMYVVNVDTSGGTPIFGIPKFSFSGNSNIYHNSSAISMGVGLIPVSQIGWRQITSAMDP